jgi:hypothetical protein
MRLALVVCLAPAVLAACSINRPIPAAPEPAALGDYLAAHRPPDLLITDSAGRARWIHNPRLDGDTLRGVRSRELPRWQVAIPLTTVRSVAAPQFSTGRTAVLVGSVLGAATIAILILSGVTPDY